MSAPGEWRGEFHAGDGWAAFRGAAGENRLHAHTAMQLVFGPNGARLRTADGTTVEGRALLARPGAPHALEPAPDVLLLFVEPQSALAGFIDRMCRPGAVSPLAAEVAARVKLGGPLANCAANLRAAAAGATVTDPRLGQALAYLAQAAGAHPVAEAAARAGLSTARLRALAHAQLGTPLTRWLVWRRLLRAGAAMASGASLAEAAAESGFADQAHLSRATRRVFGITPATAQRVVAEQAKRPRR